MNDTEEHKAFRLGRETLSLILSAHLSVVTALLSQPGKCGAKVLRAARDIHRTIRQHLKVLYQFRAQALQSDLKTNPAFRAQVAHDLGGKLAMVKWERRRRDARASAAFKAARQAQGLDYDPELINSKRSSDNDLINSQTPSSPEDATHSKPASRAPRKRWQPVTDRTGHFRWAVIPTAPKPKKIKERIVKINRAPNRPFQPVGVTAEDLRTPTFPNAEFGLPPYPPDISMPRAGVSPPIDRWPKQ